LRRGSRVGSFTITNLSLVYTANDSGIDENNSKHPISNLLTETNSHSSITNHISAEQGFNIYSSLLLVKIAPGFYITMK
jgi:hypothetical protein